ncbi:MAG: hydroxyacid dehydrogenase [Clostridia bacterium]|nr:hydroxyacid dehydrogenase [Clostridia bacterium]
MKIVIMEPLGISKENLDTLLLPLNSHNIQVYDTKASDDDEMIERAKDAEILIIANTPLPGNVISKCPHLKMISVAFVGIDHIDQEVCKKQNILISNAAGYCDDAVAELAIGLTLSVLRNIPRGDQYTRQLKTKDGIIGNELKGKTFGIIGTGAIGTRTAEIAKAFGCRIIGCNRTEKEAFKALGDYTTLDNLLQTADIVSLHTPLTNETKHLLNQEKLDLMKPSAILINTARGPIVDNQHLAKKLQEHTLAGAGIDVFDIEPPLDASDALLTCETGVYTPHVAYATHESILRRASIVIENIVLWMNNEPTRVMLNASHH